MALHFPITRAVIGDERGAAAVLMSVLLVALLAAALLSVDLGRFWISRRALASATDASALASAAHFVSQPFAACTSAGVGTARVIAEQLGAANDDTVTLEVFDVFPADCGVGSGRVGVLAAAESPVVFAPVFGMDVVQTRVRSTAQWGPLIDVERVRPLALCRNERHLQEWQTLQDSPAYSSLAGTDDPLTDVYDHPSYAGAGVVHRIPSERVSSCPGPGRGNWGWIDFNGRRSPSGRGAIAGWLDNGYELPITIGSPARGDENCQPSTSASTCEGDHEAPRGLGSALDDLVCSDGTATAACPMVPVIVYDSTSRSRGRIQYDPVAFVGIVVRGFEGIGAGDNDDDDDDDDDDRGRGRDDDDRGGGRDDDDDDDRDEYLDLEFVKLVWDGRIGTVSELVAVHGVQLCGVDDNGPDRCDV